MREDSPSRTAAWVATARHLGRILPAEGQLADDPYGAAFYSRHLAQLIDAGDTARALAALPLMRPWILYMQVRTRVIDDALRAFVARGGRQLVVLGAGYDTRALRLPELADTRVFEVDHPATQGHKRATLDRLGARSPARYVTWDFETHPMEDLPDELSDAGLDRSEPVFTIWEGVTMYLTEPAIDTSLRAIRAWSAEGSQLALTYFVRSRVTEPSLAVRALKALVATFGEPFRFGWIPDELPGYLAARGFALESDRNMADAARDLLPPQLARQVRDPTRRIALAASPEAVAVAS